MFAIFNIFGNFTKKAQPLEFHKRRPLTNSQGKKETSRNSTSFLINPWKFHMHAISSPPLGNSLSSTYWFLFSWNSSWSKSQFLQSIVKWVYGMVFVFCMVGISDISGLKLTRRQSYFCQYFVWVCGKSNQM